MNPVPRLIFWEITQKCNLHCPYCRRDNFMRSLSRAQSLQIVDSIADKFHPLLVFSGGEPLLYPYLFELVSYAQQKGLKTALATNGTLIDRTIAEEIKAAGFHRVALSLDGATPEVNDNLRGEGVFSKVEDAIRNLKTQQVPLQINATIFRKNFKQVSSIYEFCLEWGIEDLHIFAFVPVGCGINIPAGEILSKEEYEDFFKEIAGLSLRSKIKIKLTCAPQYNRLLFDRPDNPDLKLDKGCLAGTGVGFISAQGEVYPCGYLKISAGNILTDSFEKIWTTADLFQKLRHPEYLKGKCGLCEYVNLCGGCRARAYAASGDYLKEEPNCVYQPLTVKY